MIRLLDRIEAGIVGVLGLAMLALAFFQVFARYVLPGFVSSGMEELIVYIFVWAAMLACAERVTGNGHIRADIFLRSLSPRALRLTAMLSAAVSLGMCLGLTWYGAKVVEIAIQIDERSQTGVSFPMWIYYLALPAGSGLMSIRYLNVLYQMAFDYDAYTRELASETAAPLS